MSDPIVVFEAVEKRYRGNLAVEEEGAHAPDVVALASVSLTIEPGSFVAIVGP